MGGDILILFMNIRRSCNIFYLIHNFSRCNSIGFPLHLILKSVLNFKEIFRHYNSSSNSTLSFIQRGVFCGS